MKFNERVYKLVRQIPAGKVLSYSRVAYYLGTGHAARAVGTAMSNCPADPDFPWWRVITEKRRPSSSMPDGWQEQQRILLEAESVPFDASGLVLTSAFWTPSQSEIHDSI